VALLLFVLVLYFLPTIIAGMRHHHQAGTITVLNLFLGWTFLGWVITLAMACGNTQPHQVIINNVQQGAWMPEPSPVSALPISPPAALPAQTMNPMGLLRQLQELRDQGVLTQPEFEEKSRRILQEARNIA
jgi:hypothetical protein